MAATPLPWTEINRAASITPAAEVTGDTVNGHVAANDGDVEIIVRNADGAAAHNVTFVYATALSNTFDGQAVASRTVNIPISATRKFYGFPIATYGAALSITVDSTQLKLSAEHKTGV
jgi:glucose/arabinose dehydrogenase